MTTPATRWIDDYRTGTKRKLTKRLDESSAHFIDRSERAEACIGYARQIESWRMGFDDLVLGWLAQANDAITGSSWVMA